MAEYYLWIKQTHVGLAFCTLLLFMLRGLYRLLSPRVERSGKLQAADRMSYAIDTCLLLLGVTLIFVLQLNPFTVAWLGSKLVFLALYIALGVLAFRERTAKPIRWASLALAMGCWLMMYATARAHLPFWLWF